MKATFALLSLIGVVLLAACTAASSPTNPPETPSAAATATSVPSPAAQVPTTAAAPRPDPLQVTVKLDESAAVEQWITLEGGKLSLEASDGTRFTLEIPADALFAPVQVRMTPVQQVEGLPFGSRTYAVHLEPEGLFFNDFARLTIEPPDEIPVQEQIFFGYQQAGKEVFLAQPALNTSAMTILLPHFSGYGVTTGMLADIEPVRARLGGSDETRLQSQMAEAVQRERQRQILGEDAAAIPDEMDMIAHEFYNLVVLPRIAAAGESCAAGRLALETAIAFERTRALVGVGSDLPEIDLPALTETATRACLREEFALCTEQHIIHRMIPFWLSIDRMQQLLGMSDPDHPSALVEEARQLTEQCLTFELEFESSGKTMDQLLGFDGSVKASVPLRLDTSTMEITGSGTLVNVTSAFYAEGCSVDFQISDGTFQVFSLVYETDEGPSTQGNGPIRPAGSGADPGRVVDFTMNYFPGATTGPLKVVCDGVQVSNAPGTAWYSTFMMTHLDEQSSSTGGMAYTASNWTVQGGELFAERSWQREDASVATTEQGMMRLYHRPVK